MQKQQIQTIIAILFILTLFPFFSLVGSFEALAAEDFTVPAKAAIAIDQKTGKILYTQNAEEALPIASMTKMITLYLVLEQIKDGKLTWQDQVTIDAHTSAISLDYSLSNVPLVEGLSYSVKDLFDATAIVSANGAAIALATKVSGSESAFVDLMREKVKSWGINDATLYSASGLNNEDMQGQIYPGSGPNDENQMSAKSMAIVAHHLINDFPEYLDISKTTDAIFGEESGHPIPLTNWNMMLPGGNQFKEGVDGLKTGTTDLAGASFTGTIDRDGWRIVTVVLNVDNGQEDSEARFVATGKLMDYAYDHWEQKTLYKKGDALPVVKSIEVSQGVETSVPLVLGQDVTAWLPKDSDHSKIKTDFKADKTVINQEHALVAPVSKDFEVGTVDFDFGPDDLGYLEGPTENNYPIVTSHAVEKASFFVLFGRSIKHFFTNLF